MATPKNVGLRALSKAGHIAREVADSSECDETVPQKKQQMVLTLSPHEQAVSAIVDGAVREFRIAIYRIQALNSKPQLTKEDYILRA